MSKYVSRLLTKRQTCKGWQQLSVLIGLSSEGTRSVFFLGEEYHKVTWATRPHGKFLSPKSLCYNHSDIKQPYLLTILM